MNNLFTDGNREKIISSRPFIFVTLGMYGQEVPSERRKCVNITQTGTCFEI